MDQAGWDGFGDGNLGEDDDDGAGIGDGHESGWGDMDFGGSGEDSHALVAAPTKVNKVAVAYARASKQVHSWHEYAVDSACLHGPVNVSLACSITAGMIVLRKRELVCQSQRLNVKSAGHH